MTKKKITLKDIKELDAKAKAYLAGLTPKDIKKLKDDELAAMRPDWVRELQPATRQAIKLRGWMTRLDVQIAEKEKQRAAYAAELEELE